MPEENTIIPESLRNAIGVESDPITYEIEKGHIARFAEAIGDENPLYSDEIKARNSKYGGIIAPPTFYRALRPGSLPETAESPFTRNLDAGSDWEYFEPIRPGDRITVTIKLADVVEREGRLGKMIIITRETRYENQLGQIVATQKTNGISY
ncbi:MAG: MaoC family dehydratase [SAR202 cluster bacterium]|jgi:acyl dehydratase|nr:MaoC family dehydratase N-terminal domain-containing protein [Dehalococcoidia bacterium]MQG24523.1 MaoC family dehydratase [SAR202 cluster bacterium]MQG84872.1 MaoC family dehydratase [SAR202 cluster bacterium]|tara:strand:- start:2405 stop:2860 length:456 start_codon:yes stop_codon:yes gene_type:complete